MELHHILMHLAAVSNPDIKVLPHPNTSNTIKTVLGIVFSITGALSLMVMVIAGFSFITSQGDPGKVAQARNAIVYAAAGLGVSILAISIVSFVIGHV